VRYLCAITAAVSLLTGCSTSPQKAAKEAREAAGSWGATLSVTADRWSNGDIATSYFQSVVTQARTALQQESRTARKSGGGSAAAPVEAVASHLDALDDAVARGDRGAAIGVAHAAASAVAAEPTPPVARPQ
jgi:hypothetical protein